MKPPNSQASNGPQLDSPSDGDCQWQALCIDAAFEPVTCAGYRHRITYLYPKLKTMGIALVFCSGPDDTRQKVAPRASVPTVTYLTGEGHGSRTSYEGQNFDPIFQVGGYLPAEVTGKIVHFLSCRTAFTLGQDMVAKGCRAFFGYDSDFSFHPDFADLSLKCDSEIDIAFAERLNAAQVYARVRALFVKTTADLRANGGYAANWSASALETALGHLVCPTSGGPKWGDETASLS
jgi:hypothetical protein